MDDFIAFILTHGRPENVKTYKTLKRCGYTGKILLVIDDEDEKAQEYYKKFGKDKVYMFDKKSISKTFDEADNFDNRKSIVYARNACFKIAKEMGYKYFIQLDDDYQSFDYRLYMMNAVKKIKNLDNIFEYLLNYYKKIPCKSLAMAQGGDFIGGKKNAMADGQLKRKCMNTFICSTDRPFKFLGRINEDVNIYTYFQSKGNLFLTTPLLSITQGQTQTNEGGMTDIYLNNGTYIKSFYTIIFQPSSVKISLMGAKYKRLHHNINWRKTVPKIIEESYKK